uniref:Uncharacterized protein n=1 Tax=Arundo donax TaxID=35708 RepID=A0A0A9FJ78_ARUDO
MLTLLNDECTLLCVYQGDILVTPQSTSLAAANKSVK